MVDFIIEIAKDKLRRFVVGWQNVTGHIIPVAIRVEPLSTQL
jgi:hypothetical protein